jgi:hypothetical protein
MHQTKFGVHIFRFHPFKREEMDHHSLFHLIPSRTRILLNFHTTITGKKAEGSLAEGSGKSRNQEEDANLWIPL